MLRTYEGRILAVDLAVARRWGRLSQQIGNRGLELAIAATALEHGLAVATRNVADFEGCSLPNISEPLTPMGWRIRVRDRVFAYFGVTCDVDEPLSTLIARIELAERGVRCTLAH